MARRKTASSWVAAIHAVTYGLPFLFITTSAAALAVIVVSHWLIDRYRLARWATWAKNRPWPGGLKASEMTPTGYPADTPPWLAGWLAILTDNIIHVLINGAAIHFLG